MSDQRLRELERAWRAGNPEAEAQLLNERVRIGDLDRRMLELAAVLGYQPALQACGGFPNQSYRMPLGPVDGDLQIFPQRSVGVRGWEVAKEPIYDTEKPHRTMVVTKRSEPREVLRALGPVWGKEVEVRAEIAIARAQLPKYERRFCVHDKYMDGCDCEVNTFPRSLLEELEKAVCEGQPPPARMPGGGWGDEFSTWLQFIWTRLQEDDYEPQDLSAWRHRGLATLAGPYPRQLRYVRDEVAPWALGRRDPLRERVQQRRSFWDDPEAN